MTFPFILDWIFMAKFAAVVMKLPCKFLNLFVVHKKGDGPCFHCSCEPLECYIVYSSKWKMSGFWFNSRKKWGLMWKIFLASAQDTSEISFNHTKYRKFSNTRRPQKIVVPNSSWFLIGNRSITTIPIFNFKPLYILISRSFT